MTKKEAIDYLKNTEGYTFSEIDNPKHNEAIDLAIKALEERPQGEWKFDGWGTYCSECGYRPKLGSGKFCSECGADMRGGRE